MLNEKIKRASGALTAFDPKAVTSGDLVDTAAQLNALAREAAKKADALKARIVESQTFAGSVFLAKYDTIETSRFDVAGLREAHPLIAKRFTIDATSQRLTFAPR